MNDQREQKQSRQDRNLLRWLWRQSGDTRPFATWRGANVIAMENEAAEVAEENRLRYGPWTTAEIRTWRNEEESAAMLHGIVQARQTLRAEEEETIHCLQQEQARAREEQVALQEAEMAAMTALERQRNEAAASRAESEALDRILVTCRGWMVCKNCLLVHYKIEIIKIVFVCVWKV